MEKNVKKRPMKTIIGKMVKSPDVNKYYELSDEEKDKLITYVVKSREDLKVGDMIRVNRIRYNSNILIVEIDDTVYNWCDKKTGELYRHIEIDDYKRVYPIMEFKFDNAGTIHGVKIDPGMLYDSNNKDEYKEQQREIRKKIIEEREANV